MTDRRLRHSSSLNSLLHALWEKLQPIQRLTENLDAQLKRAGLAWGHPWRRRRYEETQCALFVWEEILASLEESEDPRIEPWTADYLRATARELLALRVNEKVSPAEVARAVRLAGDGGGRTAFTVYRRAELALDVAMKVHSLMESGSKRYEAVARVTAEMREAGFRYFCVGR